MPQERRQFNDMPYDQRDRSVLFHCNADTTTGLGHFMRCLALAEEALAQGWDVTITGRLNERARAIAADFIPEATLALFGDGDNSSELERVITGIGPNVIHADTYSAELKIVAPETTLISNAQDGRFGRRPSDLVVDANLFAEERHTSHDSAAALLGAEAMQIRTQVRAIQHSVRDPRNGPLQVLLVLGGTDPLNRTPTVARALSISPEPIGLTVVCREEQHPEVRAQLENVDINLSLLSFTDSLPTLANEHDLAITGAGTSTWDFAAMGIPMGLINVVDNHRDGYEAAIRANIALPLGAPDAPGFEELASAAIESARDAGALRALAARAQTHIDGLGCWRIVSAWDRMLHSPGRALKSPEDVRMRPVTIDDAATLFRWRNDPATRTASRQPNPVLWEDHIGWLEGSLHRPDRQLLIAEQPHRAVGTARWDRDGERSWEISITLAPEARGVGLAAPVLAAAEQALKSDLPVRLTATIHDTNLPSLSLFASAGYLPYEPADALGFATFAKWRLRSNPK